MTSVCAMARVSLSVCLVIVMSIGCTAVETPEPAPEVPGQNTGTARVSIKVAQVSAGEITRVTVAATGGFATDLTPDGTGSFVGTLLLPAGPTELIGKAFVEDVLVAESAPVTVEVLPGLVVAADIRLIDLTDGDIDHGPIIVTLTHPMSAIAGQAVLLSVSAVDPDGEAVSFSWSDDCDDANFADPQAAATEWVKAAVGACRVTVVVSANGLSASESFDVVVFDEGDGTGAINVGGELVSAPSIFLQFFPSNGGFCDIFSESENGTCEGSIAAPDTAFLNAFVDWGNATPGTLETFDNCGGSFFSDFADPFFVEATWLPPIAQSVCLVGVRATSPDGVSSELTAAILVKEGTAPPPVEVEISFEIQHINGFCSSPPGEDVFFCNTPMPANDTAFMFARVDWGFGQAPGEIEIFDDCNGQFFPIFSNPFEAATDWLSPPQTLDCAITVKANSPDGNSREVTLILPIIEQDPPPPDFPHMFLELNSPVGFCQADSLSGVTVCDQLPVSPGEPVNFFLQIDWGPSIPGLIDASDNCGGVIDFVGDPFFVEGQWTAPPAATECEVKVNALSADGFASEMIVIIFVGANQPPPPPPAQEIVMVLTSASIPVCDAHSQAPAPLCGSVTTNEIIFFEGSVDWGNVAPGSISIADDCGGVFNASANVFFFQGEWTAPAEPVQCNLRVTALSADAAGAAVELSLGIDVIP